MLTVLRPRNSTPSRLPMPSDRIRRVLQCYDEPFASAPFVRYPSSGLSGAELWRMDIGGDRYVLRRWPDGQMKADRLEWIHEILRRTTDREFGLVPVPVVSRNGVTFVQQDGTYWQLEPWLPGEPDLTE